MVIFSSLSSTTNATSPYFDVMDYGAVGDGKTDDSQAFLKAWNETCKAQSPDATMNIPAKTFLVNPAKFWGPCVPTRINIQVAGQIIANTDQSLYSNNYWLHFAYLGGLTLTGSGTIDGQGAGSWPERKGVAALQLFSITDLEINGLTHTNPQKAHISMTGCNGVNINNITISAPEDSPNTDGIDIGYSSHIQIQNSKIGTGDDCIAISTNCSFINITDVTCGPGHGISIGSLGNPVYGGYDTVSEIHVRSCDFIGKNTTGVRIKTWQGGHGEVRNITYEYNKFYDIARPIVIDQFYCPDNACQNNTGTSAVAISDVSYTNMGGTSSGDDPAISLRCGDKNSCNNIVLDNVHIKNSDSTKPASADCLNVKGISSHAMLLLQLKLIAVFVIVLNEDQLKY
ncbi:probable polygalacturonase At3g15720 [Vitis riparia]|uniref:probable polygalacturonase At3g15720 n=1 Tax=Vitis riparia TaxID=96939 RepID=UPI00155B048E|nr:probable polygalacturonase At3g15720 [Vitis riparia]